jgi:hypothetical protein
MINQQLLYFLKQQLQLGLTREKITSDLLASGWINQDIEEGFQAISTPPSPISNTNQPVIPVVSSQNNINNAQSLDSIGKLFSDAWHLYKERFFVSLGIFFIPLVFIGIGQQLILKSWFFTSIIFNTIGYLVLMLTLATFMISVSKRTDLVASYRGGIKIFWPMLWMLILVFFATFGGLVMLIIPGIMMAIWLFFSGYVLVVEGKRGVSVMSQSREYVRGYWWSIFGRYLLFMVPFYAVIYLVTRVLGKTNGPIVSQLLELFVLPFILIYTFKLYENLVAIKPTLANTQSRSNRKFFVTSIIIGFLAIPSIVFTAGYLFLIHYKVVTQNTTLSQSTNFIPNSQFITDLQNPSSWPQTYLGTTGTQIGHFSVGLAPGYGVEYVDASTALIRLSAAPYTSYLKVGLLSENFSNMLTTAKAILSNHASTLNPLIVTTSTIAGFPATLLSVNGYSSAFILMPIKTPAGNSVMVINKQYDNADIGDQSQKLLENQVLDDIATSLEFSSTGNPNATVGTVSQLAPATMTFGPTENNTYYINSTYPITWTTPSWAKGLIVEIELWVKDNSSCYTDPQTGVNFCGTMIGLLQGSNTFNGSYSWKIPNEVIPENNYMVSVSFNGLSGAQSEPFSIKRPITTISPTSPSYVFPIKELGIEITVPNDLKLITYAEQPTEDGIAFSSASLKNLVTQLDPSEKYCGDADGGPIGNIAPIDSSKLANCMDPKLINGTYFCGTFGIGNALPDDYCAGNQQVHNLIRQQTEELGTAFDNSAQAY